MPFNELRKDYLLDRWVVIATERSRRPTDFAKQKRVRAKTDVCPMCPGNENMTPPAVLVYLESNKDIRRAMDKDGQRHKDWLVRCVSNLYPAFSPPNNGYDQKRTAKNGDFALAVGHHEVLIESPAHDEHPANAKTKQLTYVISAYIDRLCELSAKPYVKYVSIFRNHGIEAGASLSHAHSQIIATPLIPSLVEEELRASRKHWKQHEECAFCDILKRESNSPRCIIENSSFVAFAPYASVNPLEFWIAPKKHDSTLLRLSRIEVEILAKTLKTCLKGLERLANDPPYNYGFHLAIGEDAVDCYHWHLEVYPKLATWAGFEKSTAMYINTVTPEATAESLRKVISS